jgi:hypothetical protein
VKNGLLKFALILFIILLITVIGFSNVHAWVNDIFDEDPQKNYAIADARDALSNILKLYPIDLSDKQAVANIRYKVDLAINNYNATEIRNDSNYYFLEVAERRLEELEGSNQPPQDQTTDKKSPPAEDKTEVDYKKIALDNIVKEINNLPEPQSIELNDNNLNLVTSARSLVDLYIQDYNGKASDISNIQKLIALEERIAEIEESINKEPDVEILAIDVVNEAISKLPRQEVMLSDENLINSVRQLIDYLAEINQVKESEIESIDKLLEAERGLEDLKQDKELKRKKLIQGFLNTILGLLILLFFLTLYCREYYPEKLVFNQNTYVYIFVTVAVVVGIGAALIFPKTKLPPPRQDTHIGLWKSGVSGKEVYFDFFDNENINIYMLAEEHWFETSYRLVNDSSFVYLVLYQHNFDKWEKSAYFNVIKDILVIHNIHTGKLYLFKSAAYSELTTIINDISFERLPHVGIY